MANQLVIQAVKELKQASTKNEAPIWLKIAKLAQKPSSSKQTINVNKINELTKEGDIAIVPGKILGTGNISHKITIASFSISNTAAKKITGSGGNIVNFSTMIEKHPTGKGVKIIV